MITLYYYIAHTKDTVTLMAKSCRLNDGMLSTEIVTFLAGGQVLWLKEMTHYQKVVSSNHF